MDSISLVQVSRFLSYTVIVISVFMKLPQVFAIFISGNTEGVNLKTYWLEIATYLIGFFFGYTHGYHISIYLESGLLAIQSATIIFLVVYYERKWTAENLMYTFLFVAFIATSLLKLVPLSLLRILLSLTLPLSVVSKLAQLSTIFQIKSKGNVSILSWSLAAYGCLARIITVSVEVGDPQIILNFFVSFVLNTMVVAMCMYYGNGIEKQKI